MNQCDITYGISALANWIADQLSDEELAFYASLFAQLGDTLATIAARRDLCKSNGT
ncbi:MAG: DUF6774 domain-containing protein [Christensenellales bacterium]